MLKWLDQQTVNILAVLAIVAVITGITLVLVDTDLYSVAVVIMLGSISLAVLTRKVES